jgi:hypothetical protein
VQSLPRNAAGRVMRRTLLQSVMPHEAIEPHRLDEYR